MSTELIERLRFDASVRVNGTAMTAADNLVEAADALEIAIAGMNAYSDELGRCRKAAGFGPADDPMAQEGFDALGDPLCVAAFVESQFKRIVAERDTLAAELDALKYILFRSLLNITGDDWRESASKAIKGYSPYQSKPAEAGIFEKAEVARLKKQFERYPCGCTDWEKQHCRGETSPFAEHPDCQRMRPPKGED